MSSLLAIYNLIEDTEHVNVHRTVPEAAGEEVLTSVLLVQVVVLDKLDYCATLNNLKEITSLPNFKFVRGCIQSFDLVAHVLETENVDTVMHFAAQVPASIRWPLDTLRRRLKCSCCLPLFRCSQLGCGAFCS